MKKSWYEWPWHPLLLALYAPLALLAVNHTELRAAAGVRSIALSLVLAMVLVFLARMVYRSWDRAGIAASVLLLFFFSYGHLYDWGRHLSPFAFQIVRHRALVPALGLLVLGALLWLRNPLDKAAAITASLNLVSLLLLVLPTVTVGMSEWRYRQADAAQDAVVADECLAGAALPSNPPDVYYIILDAYARADVLRSTYDYDNQWFLDGLRSLGFYVAQDSQSNYARTGLSLTSSLNMEYLPKPPESGEESYWPSLGNNRLRQVMKCLGYQVVAFDSGYYWSGWRDADYFLTPTNRSENAFSLTGMNAFEAFFADSTLVRLVNDAGEVVPEFLRPDVQGPLKDHYFRVQYAFDQLSGGVTRLPGPKFVFAHIVSPHPPYVFDREGDFLPTSPRFTFLDPNEEKLAVSELQAYPEQVEYVSTRTLDAVEHIIEASDGNVVILVQGDHGIGKGRYDRMSNLSAYYLPGNPTEDLYPTITPVNSFRLVLDDYFGANLPLLEDVSYFSTYDDLYDFVLVPNPASGKQP